MALNHQFECIRGVGGKAEESLRASLNSEGSGVVVPVSRQISRAKNKKEMAEALRNEFNVVRRQHVGEREEI